MQIPSPYVTHIFPLVLQHPETFAAQIALISCWTDLQRPKHALKRAMNNVLYYRAIAISRLRSKLMKPGAYADDATILATMYLLSVDVGVSSKWLAAILFADVGSSCHYSNLMPCGLITPAYRKW